MCPRTQTTEPKLPILVSFFSGEVTSYTDTNYCILIVVEVCRSVFFYGPTGIDVYSIILYPLYFGILPDSEYCFDLSSSAEFCQDSTSSETDGYCHCDTACDHYEDCCYGYGNLTASSASLGNISLTDRSLWECVRFTLGLTTSSACIYDYLVVSRCPPGPDVDNGTREKCEHAPSNSTVFFDNEGVFYRNKYCAFCNGVSSSELLPYIIILSCLDSFKTGEAASCGYRSYIVNGTWPPPIRVCIGKDSQYVTHCSEGNKTANGTNGCPEQTARLKIDNVVYKNAECAVCNMVELNVSSISPTCPLGDYPDLVIRTADREVISVFAHPVILFVFNDLQCPFGTTLVDTTCVPENVSWPVCHDASVTLADFTDGSPQCFDGIEILKIQVEQTHPNVSVDSFRDFDDDQFIARVIVFPSEVLPRKSEIERFFEETLQNETETCCKDKYLMIIENCEYEHVTTNNTILLSDDFAMFQPVSINETTYILYNQSTYLIPTAWQNYTSYVRAGEEWRFDKRQEFLLLGQIVEIETCPFLVVDNPYFKTDGSNNTVLVRFSKLTILNYTQSMMHIL